MTERLAAVGWALLSVEFELTGHDGHECAFYGCKQTQFSCRFRLVIVCLNFAGGEEDERVDWTREAMVVLA